MPITVHFNSIVAAEGAFPPTMSHPETSHATVTASPLCPLSLETHLGDVSQGLLDAYVPEFLDDLLAGASALTSPMLEGVASPATWFHMQPHDIPMVDDADFNAMLEDEEEAEVGTRTATVCDLSALLDSASGTTQRHFAGGCHGWAPRSRKLSRSGSLCSVGSITSSRAESMLRGAPSLAASTCSSAQQSPYKDFSSSPYLGASDATLPQS